jgi:cysteine synthase B
MSEIHTDISGPALPGLVGRTPLLELRRLGRLGPRVRLLAKLESRNPGGSVKDRAALGIVRAALATGELTPGGTLLDATSGNTGIAYAMLGAALGFHVRLCVPGNANRERQALLAAYGAEVLWTDPLEGSDGAIRRAREIAAGGEAGVYYADQYSNPANWRAHYETTGPEILEQADGRITHFVAGLGTTGTLMGVGRRLREHDPNVRLVGVQPDAPFHGLEGLKHLESALVPAIYDPRLPDRHLFVSTEDAQRAALRLAREEGILAGPSGGAALAAALIVASEVTEGTIVVLLPDGGERYLGEAFLGGMP